MMANEVGCHQNSTKDNMETPTNGAISKSQDKRMNAQLGLPEGPMEKVIVAFDVDGTLITNTGAKPDIANERIVNLLKILASFKNIKIVVWSGGGKEYAERWGKLTGVDEYVWQYMSKITAHMNGFKPTIAIDDIQDTKLGQINLIVREK